jgi:hypothetical protein
MHEAWTIRHAEINHVRRMKAICCSNQGSLSRRDAIVDNLTHKEILRPDAPVATVGK